MGDVLGPLLQRRGPARRGPVDVTGILTQMLQMGDEAHNRNRAGHPDAAARPRPRRWSPAGFDAADVAEALRFIGGNDHFFLNLAMPACKLALDAARGIDGSTMVVAMARNGTDFGIQVAGTGDEWFTGPAQLADGLFLGDYGPDDANPDIGDSAITETAGIGGFAMATAPAIVRFVGGSVPDALATTRRMHEITLGENPRWSVPGPGVPGHPDRHRRHQGLPDRDPAADQHRHGRQGGRRRPGRRRPGHPARRDLPQGAGRPGVRARTPRPPARRLADPTTLGRLAAGEVADAPDRWPSRRNSCPPHALAASTTRRRASRQTHQPRACSGWPGRERRQVDAPRRTRTVSGRRPQSTSKPTRVSDAGLGGDRAVRPVHRRRVAVDPDHGGRCTPASTRSTSRVPRPGRRRVAPAA